MNKLVFPNVVISYRDIGHKRIEQLSKGLTKREYFAGLAMQGMLAFDYDPSPQVARLAVTQAEALIKELNKNE